MYHYSKTFAVSFQIHEFIIRIFQFSRNPTDDQVFSYIDQLVDLNEILYPEPRRAKKRNLEPFRISQIIESCHANQSIYEVTLIVDVEKKSENFALMRLFVRC